MPAIDAKLNLLVTGAAGFIGSNLILELQERFPNSRLSAIDDFRSGDFKNLGGYRGDFVAADLAKLNWREQFGDEKFDAIFHLASITDTTNHNQFEQTHDNVESFRRLLEFARPNQTRVIFASSASIYGATTEASAESTVAAPANIYAFSKAIMDNLATRFAREGVRGVEVEEGLLAAGRVKGLAGAGASSRVSTPSAVSFTSTSWR